MALTYKELFSMENMRFIKWLNDTFPVCVPAKVSTMPEMEKASEQMLALSAQYSYITEMSTYAKIYCRELKRLVDKNDSETKEFYEDMVDKKDAIENKMKAIHQAYNGISRAVSVRIENNNELRMTGARGIRLT